jgi:ubiquinone/menaquinone biosynthesis C-methylase UbiE
MSLQQVERDVEHEFAGVNRAFSKQSFHYDDDDARNPILISWRRQVYAHVERLLKPGSHILELNAGTGIDAAHFAAHGHTVHCIDISEGMIAQIEKKRTRLRIEASLTCEVCSFDSLGHIDGSFDFIFSNFGGLNCIDRLEKVTLQLRELLRPGALVTCVIMPPISLWELGWILKGHWRSGLRRFQKGGTTAHLEGEYFKTHYHSYQTIVKAFGEGFKLVDSEGLGSLSPPPSEAHFPDRHPRIYKLMRNLDHACCKHFPFNRWADHVIVTFQKKQQANS